MLLQEVFYQTYYFKSRFGKASKHGTDVFKNPSLAEFSRMIRKNDVRGMMYKNDLYVWDAETLHVEIFNRFRQEDPNFSFREAQELNFHLLKFMNPPEGKNLIPLKELPPKLYKLLDQLPQKDIRVSKALIRGNRLNIRIGT